MSKLLLLGVVTLAILLSIAAVLADQSLPQILNDGGDDQPVLVAVPIVETTYRNAERVSLELLYSDSVDVPLPATGGRVTALAVGPGDYLACGETAVQIDGVDRPLFCGETPLYRSLGRREVGADVAALHAFLFDLGLDPGVSDPDRIGPAIRQAIREFRSDFGLSPGDTFSPAFVVFATGPLPIGEVQVSVGDLVEPEQVLFSSQPELLSATFRFDANLTELVHVVEADGLSFPVSLDPPLGSVLNPEPLQAVIDQGGLAEDGTLEVTLRLRDELPVMSAPTGAVLSSGDSQCLVTERSAEVFEISIVDSRAGSTFFLPIDELAGASVLLDPANPAIEC